MLHLVLVTHLIYMISMNIKENKFVIIGFIICLIYFLIAQSMGTKRYNQYINEFNKVKINGKIEYVSKKHRGSLFRIEGNSVNFVFYPILSESNNFKQFYKFASRGDSIYKSTNSDILKLFKKDNVYIYEFQKPK